MTLSLMTSPAGLCQLQLLTLLSHYGINRHSRSLLVSSMGEFPAPLAEVSPELDMLRWHWSHTWPSTLGVRVVFQSKVGDQMPG